MRWFRRRGPASDPTPTKAQGKQDRGNRRKGRGTAEPAGEPADTGPAEAAVRFWARWEELLPAVNAALGDREPRRVEHELYEAVAAVHPELHFSLDRGRNAVYALVVSGQEDPALRPYTDAWKAAAPPDDVVWEYHDSVPAVPDPDGVTVNLSGHRMRLADFVVAARVDEDGGVVDVAVYHPALSELEEPARSAMTFLPLDATLGERLAGERLRRVEATADRPADAITLRELKELVQRLANRDVDPGAGDRTTPGDRPA